MHISRGIVKTAIALFCLWHIAAIGIFSLQNVDRYPVLKWLQNQEHYVRPYVLMTSQWQKWNLFSPDPLRRITNMQVDAQLSGVWSTVRILDYDHLTFFRRASELKVMRQFEDDNMVPLRERYVQDVCKTESIPSGTPMRIRKEITVVPKPDKIQSVKWWRSWKPRWQETTILETTCGNATDANPSSSSS